MLMVQPSAGMEGRMQAMSIAAMAQSQQPRSKTQYNSGAPLGRPPTGAQKPQMRPMTGSRLGANFGTGTFK